MEARITEGDTKSEHVFDLLSPFVDGETSIDETRHIERHIAACSVCSGQLAFLRATARTMRHASDALPSTALFERIARATYEKPTFGARLSEFLRPAPVRMALGGVLAAGLVAAVMVPHLNTASQLHSAGNGEAAKPDLASVPSPAKTVKTPVGTGTLASAVKPAPQATPFGLSPRTASLGVPLALNFGRYLSSASAAPTASLAKPTVKSVAPRSVVDARDTFVRTTIRPIARPDRAAQAPPTASVVKRAEAPSMQANTIPAAASRLIRSGAAKLMTTPTNSLAATILRNELANRSINPRAERPTLPKVEMPTAVAAVTPEPVKPTSKPEDTNLPNPVADTPRPVAPKSGFSLAGAGTGTKNAGFLLISHGENFSALSKDGVVGIVQAPMGSK